MKVIRKNLKRRKKKSKKGIHKDNISQHENTDPGYNDFTEKNEFNIEAVGEKKKKKSAKKKKKRENNLYEITENGIWNNSQNDGELEKRERNKPVDQNTELLELPPKKSKSKKSKKSVSQNNSTINNDLSASDLHSKIMNEYLENFDTSDFIVVEAPPRNASAFNSPLNTHDESKNQIETEKTDNFKNFKFLNHVSSENQSDGSSSGQSVDGGFRIRCKSDEENLTHSFSDNSVAKHIYFDDYYSESDQNNLNISKMSVASDQTKQVKNNNKNLNKKKKNTIKNKQNTIKKKQITVKTKKNTIKNKQITEKTKKNKNKTKKNKPKQVIHNKINKVSKGRLKKIEKYNTFISRLKVIKDTSKINETNAQKIYREFIEDLIEYNLNRNAQTISNESFSQQLIEQEKCDKATETDFPSIEINLNRKNGCLNQIPSLLDNIIKIELKIEHLLQQPKNQNSELNSNLKNLPIKLKTELAANEKLFENLIRFVAYLKEISSGLDQNELDLSLNESQNFRNLESIDNLQSINESENNLDNLDEIIDEEIVVKFEKSLEINENFSLEKNNNASDLNMTVDQENESIEVIIESSENTIQEIVESSTKVIIKTEKDIETISDALNSNSSHVNINSNDLNENNNTFEDLSLNVKLEKSSKKALSTSNEVLTTVQTELEGNTENNAQENYSQDLFSDASNSHIEPKESSPVKESNPIKKIEKSRIKINCDYLFKNKKSDINKETQEVEIANVEIVSQDKIIEHSTPIKLCKELKVVIVPSPEKLVYSKIQSEKEKSDSEVEVEENTKNAVQNEQMPIKELKVVIQASPEKLVYSKMQSKKDQSTNEDKFNDTQENYLSKNTIDIDLNDLSENCNNCGDQIFTTDAQNADLPELSPDIIESSENIVTQQTPLELEGKEKSNETNLDRESSIDLNELNISLDKDHSLNSNKSIDSDVSKDLDVDKSTSNTKILNESLQESSFSKDQDYSSDSEQSICSTSKDLEQIDPKKKKLEESSFSKDKETSSDSEDSICSTSKESDVEELEPQRERLEQSLESSIDKDISSEYQNSISSTNSEIAKVIACPIFDLTIVPNTETVCKKKKRQSSPIKDTDDLNLVNQKNCDNNIELNSNKKSKKKSNKSEIISSVVNGKTNSNELDDSISSSNSESIENPNKAASGNLEIIRDREIDKKLSTYLDTIDLTIEPKITESKKQGHLTKDIESSNLNKKRSLPDDLKDYDDLETGIKKKKRKTSINLEKSTDVQEKQLELNNSENGANPPKVNQEINNKPKKRAARLIPDSLLNNYLDNLIKSHIQIGADNEIIEINSENTPFKCELFGCDDIAKRRKILGFTDEANKSTEKPKRTKSTVRKPRAKRTNREPVKRRKKNPLLSKEDTNQDQINLNLVVDENKKTDALENVEEVLDTQKNGFDDSNLIPDRDKNEIDSKNDTEKTCQTVESDSDDEKSENSEIYKSPTKNLEDFIDLSILKSINDEDDDLDDFTADLINESDLREIKSGKIEISSGDSSSSEEEDENIEDQITKNNIIVEDKSSKVEKSRQIEISSDDSSSSEEEDENIEDQNSKNNVIVEDKSSKVEESNTEKNNTEKFVDKKVSDRLDTLRKVQSNTQINDLRANGTNLNQEDKDIELVTPPRKSDNQTNKSKRNEIVQENSKAKPKQTSIENYFQIKQDASEKQDPPLEDLQKDNDGFISPNMIKTPRKVKLEAQTPKSNKNNSKQETSPRLKTIEPKNENNSDISFEESQFTDASQNNNKSSPAKKDFFEKLQNTDEIMIPGCQDTSDLLNDLLRSKNCTNSDVEAMSVTSRTSRSSRTLSTLLSNYIKKTTTENLEDDEMSVTSSISDDDEDDGDENEKFSNNDSFFNKTFDYDDVYSAELSVTHSQLETITNMKFKAPKKVAPLHKIHPKSTKLMPETRKTLRERKLKYKKGKYTTKEDQKILTNWTRFCQLHNLNEQSPGPFFSFRRTDMPSFKDEERTKFLHHLGQGLDDRLLCSIYARFKRLFFQVKVNRGRYTEEEDEEIIKYLNESDDPTPYLTLSEKMNRDKGSLEKRVNYLMQFKDSKIGPGRMKWSMDLMAKLVKYLLRYSACDDISDLEKYKINTSHWRKISKRMKIPIPRLKAFWSFRLYPGLFLPDDIVAAEFVDLVSKIILKKGYEEWKQVNWLEVSKELIDFYPGFNSLLLNRVFKRVIRDHVPPSYKTVKEALNFMKKVPSSEIMLELNIERFAVDDKRSVQRHKRTIHPT